MNPGGPFGFPTDPHTRMADNGQSAHHAAAKHAEPQICPAGGSKCARHRPTSAGSCSIAPHGPRTIAVEAPVVATTCSKVVIGEPR